MQVSLPSFGASDVSALQSSGPRTAKPSEKALEEQKAFQGFAAGTFYQTMMKAMRSTERETKYFNGGRAEKIFRSEFDQHVASSMAEEHGERFAGPLFDQYTSMVRLTAENKQAQLQTAPQAIQTATSAVTIDGAYS